MDSQSRFTNINWAAILDNMNRTAQALRSQHTNIKKKCNEKNYPISEELENVKDFLSHVQTMIQESQQPYNADNDNNNSHDMSVRLIDETKGLVASNLELQKKKTYLQEKKLIGKPRGIRKMKNLQSIPTAVKEKLLTLAHSKLKYDKDFQEDQMQEMKTTPPNTLCKNKLTVSVLSSNNMSQYPDLDFDTLVKRMDMLLASTGFHVGRDMEAYLDVFTQDGSSALSITEEATNNQVNCNRILNILKS
jgi:hypothetical protein